MEYPRQLERELNARGGCNHYQVVNVAYAGQSLGSFSRRVDNVVAEIKPRFALAYPTLLTYVDPPSEDADPTEWVKENSAFQFRVRGKFFNVIDTMPEWAATIRYKLHIWKATRHAAVMQRIPEANVERFHRDLCRLLDNLEQKHIEAVLVTHATRFGKRVLPEERPMLVAWRRFAPTLNDPGFLDMENRLNNVIRMEAAARRLILVDAAENVSGRENFADFAHFTDRGANVMAKLIADRLLAAEDSHTQPCSESDVLPVIIAPMGARHFR
ncbi:MAG TPA: hypothetical protein VK604_19965 [Bryobacteraceae bacterium]|nr:hypothetical protein [Bryobacteraceae bacterium]